MRISDCGLRIADFEILTRLPDFSIADCGFEIDAQDLQSAILKAAAVYGLDDFLDRLLFYEDVPHGHLVDDLPDDLRGGDLLAVVVNSAG